ncbi:hypothetical protein [Pseudoalteromonas maricaloris]|uniref:hypothetical protein n=1 Tax=Pseudoalteromonas maricaloris TaxID=184924 RepID=UPI003C1E1027
MSNYDDVVNFYNSLHISSNEKTHDEFPLWVKTKRQEEFFTAIKKREEICLENIRNIKRGQIDQVKKRDVIIQGTAVCDLAKIGRKHLTPALEPDVIAEIRLRNQQLERRLNEKKKAFKKDTTQRKSEVLKANKELKSDIKSLKDEKLVDYFESFEASEWASSIESVHEKLKKARAEIVALEKENANLRNRNNELMDALQNRSTPKLTVVKSKDDN